MNYTSKNNIDKILEGVSKKIPQGIMIGDSYIGHITWQMYLLKDYLKLDGTPLANASVDYKELLKFVQDNNLITADTTDKSLFKYDSTTDILTLPNYIDLVLQGGNIVEEKEAGLPNITSKSFIASLRYTDTDPTTAIYDAVSYLPNRRIEANTTSDAYNTDILKFNASYSNSIYGNSTTVQPPAITLIPQIKYKKSTTMWETVEIGKFVATAPAHYEREQLYTTNKTTITIYPTWVNINGMGYVLEGTKTIDIENADNWDDSQYTVASNRAGKDFYIYACESVSDVAPKFILSANSTVPTGYTADNSRKIGGFHCLCLSVGTISGHTLSGYLTGDILPQSPWDLKHRAISENEGMVYVPEIGKWVDIYLASYDSSKLVSTFGGVIIDGESTPKMHGEQFVENFGLVKKQLPSRDDFVVFAKGSNEGTTILGSADPNTTGGHVDTSNRRMISNYGIEDCCGVLWQWTKDTAEHYATAVNNTSYWNGTNYSFSGYAWQTKPVYNPDCDPQSYGSCLGFLRRLLVGGAWGLGVNCGSRSLYAHSFGSRLDASFGARGCDAMRVV